jgi:hypothetical protein
MVQHSASTENMATKLKCWTNSDDVVETEIHPWSPENKMGIFSRTADSSDMVDEYGKAGKLKLNGNITNTAAVDLQP